MLTHNHKKLYDRLNKNILDKPQIIDAPTATVRLSNEHETQTLTVGEGKIITHYSHWKERMHRKDKNNKRFRQLRKLARKEASRFNGDDLPPSSFVLRWYLGLCWEIVIG